MSHSNRNQGPKSHSKPSTAPQLSQSSSDSHRQKRHQLYEAAYIGAPGCEATVNEVQTEESPAREDHVDDGPGQELPVDEYDADQAPVEVDSRPGSRLMLNSKGEKGNTALQRYEMQAEQSSLCRQCCRISFLTVSSSNPLTAYGAISFYGEQP
jgi:hypothetical protein